MSAVASPFLKPAAPKPHLSATLSPGGKKIVLAGVRNRTEAADFFDSMPYHSWLPSKCAWTCEPTPYAAHRILNGPFASVDPDEAVRALAEKWVSSQRAVAALAARTDLAQPPKRRFDAWPWQVPAYHFASAMDAAMLAIVMGGGKSKLSVDISVNHAMGTILILCPVAVLGVWRREFGKHADMVDEVLVLDGSGSVKKKAQQAAEFVERQRRLKRPAVVVVNYETSWRPDFAEWALSGMWDLVMLDESQRCKAHNSKCSLFAADVRRRSGRRLCLSGTPLPHSPLDAFGQYRFLDPAIFGTSFHRFRSEFAIENPHIPEMVVGWKNMDEFARRFGLLAYRVEADVLRLPEPTHAVVPVKLSPAAAKVYAGLENDMIADVGSGVVTAANALVRLVRLRQATSGFCVRDEDQAKIELADDKARALEDLLTDFPTDEPVIVFSEFLWDLDAAAKVADKLGRRYGELSGRRHDMTPNATLRDDVDLMGVQCRSGGVGIDFTRSRYGVVMGTGWLSPGDYDQLLARMVRPGQERLVTFYHLIAEDTIDETVVEARLAKADVILAVLARMKEQA